MVYGMLGIFGIPYRSIPTRGTKIQYTFAAQLTHATTPPSFQSKAAVYIEERNLHFTRTKQLQFAYKLKRGSSS
ncbi:hypothetical protein ACS0TY_036116 [Phlomoides rotata]